MYWASKLGRGHEPADSIVDRWQANTPPSCPLSSDTTRTDFELPWSLRMCRASSYQPSTHNQSALETDRRDGGVVIVRYVCPLFCLRLLPASPELWPYIAGFLRLSTVFNIHINAITVRIPWKSNLAVCLLYVKFWTPLSHLQASSNSESKRSTDSRLIFVRLHFLWDAARVTSKTNTPSSATQGPRWHSLRFRVSKAEGSVIITIHQTFTKRIKPMMTRDGPRTFGRSIRGQSAERRKYVGAAQKQVPQLEQRLGPPEQTMEEESREKWSQESQRQREESTKQRNRGNERNRKRKQGIISGARESHGDICTALKPPSSLGCGNQPPNEPFNPNDKPCRVVKMAPGRYVASVVVRMCAKDWTTWECSFFHGARYGIIDAPYPSAGYRDTYTMCL